MLSGMNVTTFRLTSKPRTICSVCLVPEHRLLNLLYCKRPTSLYFSISLLEELSRHPVWQFHTALLARSDMLFKTRLHYILNWIHQLNKQYVLLLMNVKTFWLTFQQKAMYQVCYYLDEQTGIPAVLWQKDYNIQKENKHRKLLTQFSPTW
jgi:hypothetical protein